jgi:CheY-like chemotaxis protein
MIKILIVDDDATMLDVVERALVALGLPLERASNGKEAIARIAAGTYALVVTDLIMPGRTGLSVIDSIRKHHRKLPIIVCSGYITPVVEKGLAGDSCLRIIRKPFKSELLLETARELLKSMAEENRGISSA